jgi:hypothetical protein
MGRWVRVCLAVMLSGLGSCAAAPPRPVPLPGGTVLAGPLPRQRFEAPALPDPPPARAPEPPVLTPAASVSALPFSVEPPPLILDPPMTETLPPAPGSTPLSTPPPIAYAGGEPCRKAVSGTSPVAEACRREGVPGAKTVMKQMVRDGWAAGLALTCDDCHVDRTDHGRLTADAGSRFAQLLAVFGNK